MTFAPHRRATGDDDAARDATSAEREWVTGIRAGDPAAFEAMFRAYYDPLCRSVASLLGNRDAAEDVVQEVFARIWRDHANWAVTSPRHYLFAAARRSATSHFRHATVRRRAAPVLARELAGRTEAVSADAELEAEELRRRLERALAALPRRTREAFVLSRSDGLSYNEVAVRMDISPKTVGVHIGNALAFLRRSMAPVTILAVFSALH